jgi:hypothetical protein
MLGVAFDWAYWFMTALCFRPCDYAQLWDSHTGYIYTMTDRGLQERFAGAASAKNCSWFTDNGVQEFFYNRTDKDQPYVIRVDTGMFTGAYTLDEQDQYVFTGKPAIKMWLMCIPPLFGWVTLAWLIFTHERVTCLNYHKVTAWFDKHGDGDDHKDEDQDRISEVDVSKLDGIQAFFFLLFQSLHSSTHSRPLPTFPHTLFFPRMPPILQYNM